LQAKYLFILKNPRRFSQASVRQDVTTGSILCLELTQNPNVPIPRWDILALWHDFYRKMQRATISWELNLMQLIFHMDSGWIS